MPLSLNNYYFYFCNFFYFKSDILDIVVILSGDIFWVYVYFTYKYVYSTYKYLIYKYKYVLYL